MKDLNKLFYKLEFYTSIFFSKLKKKYSNWYPYHCIKCVLISSPDDRLCRT